MRVSNVNKDGLVVVSKNDALQPQVDLVVIPQVYMESLLTALHLQLNHPSAFQLKKVFNRRFYGVNSEKMITDITNQCHQCLSLRKLPSVITPSSTSAPYQHIGSNFCADIMIRQSQKILVVSEEVTKYTKALILEG